MFRYMVTNKNSKIDDAIDVSRLAEQLRVGDIVFIRIDILLFKKVARDTGSWTNHVGVVVGHKDGECLIAESTFPFSRITTLSRFVKRSENGRVAVMRPKTPIESHQHTSILESAKNRCGIFYDAGFNLHSKGQYCSRYVHEVMKEAVGLSLGKTTTFGVLLKENPNADLIFWSIWYLGRIPWERETITPSSILECPNLLSLFDGYAENKKRKFFTNKAP